jgi:hypothetical protein
VNGFISQWEFSRREGAKHEFNDLSLAGWPSDADADTDEFSRSQVLNNRPHPIVAGISSFQLEFNAAERKIEIVVDDDQVTGEYREMSAQPCHRFAAGIHVSHRLGEHDLLRCDRSLPVFCRREVPPQDNAMGCA